MSVKTELSLLNIVLTISEAVDMVSPHLANHHSCVAYIVRRLAEALDFSDAEQETLALAGAMHDIGVLSLAEGHELSKFEIEIRPDHGEVGYLFLKPFAPLAEAGKLIRDHHVYWRNGAGESLHGRTIPAGSHLVHLADRVAVLINPQQEILTQVESIRERIVGQSGRMFVPRFVQAFLDIADREFFWFEAVSPTMEWHLPQNGKRESLSLNSLQFMELARLFCHIVDFKSPFTAAHSSGVAACAGELGRLSGLPAPECDRLTIAGYFHDIGKLSVPLEILEKPGALDVREIAVIRQHAYHTFKILQRIGMDEDFRNWSSYHHERLDGSGYPFHLSAPQLSFGCRVMTVADIFTALVENRPYRPGLPRQKAISILQNMTARNWLDGDLVRTISGNFDEVNSICQQAEETAQNDYQSFASARQDYEQQVMA